MAKLSDFTTDKGNANKGTQRGLKALDTSLRQYGAGRSILVDKKGRVIAGNKTLERAADIGMDDVIVVESDGTKLIAVKRTDLDLESEDGRARALATYDNRVGQLDLDWDIDALSAVDSDVLKDLWTVDELDKMGVIEKPMGDADPQIDRAAELQEKWQVKTGDLWRIGDHRLLCGDSTELIPDGIKVHGGYALCLTDPPYGLGEKKKSGKNDYKDYDDSLENLKILAGKWLPIAIDICKAVVFFPGILNIWLYPQADWIMSWFYGGGQLRSPWGFNCWQPILCYGKDPSLASGHGGRPDAVEMNVPANQNDLAHPCPKPLKLWEWLINRLSFSLDDIVFDPFLGSGTTMVACQNLGRKCRAIEISPEYCAVTLERMATAFPGIEIERT